MKITIKATPEEIKKLFKTDESQEQFPMKSGGFNVNVKNRY
ncbi:hypothetical protein [Convivina intestini]|nr:hypothetical protein [Convivina intestini]CAH1853891.1 hypothetical protein R078131_00858 [Convivina intestini]